MISFIKEILQVVRTHEISMRRRARSFLGGRGVRQKERKVERKKKPLK